MAMLDSSIAILFHRALSLSSSISNITP